jgi:REP element-mobilizing transposase RayT
MIQKTGKSHAKNLRYGRFSESGQVYVITTATRDRRPLFQDFMAARALIQTMMNHERLGFTATLCFAVMPDHLHWMMQLGEGKCLGKIVQALEIFDQ